MNKRFVSVIISLMIIFNIFSVIPIAHSATVWSEDFETDLSAWSSSTGMEITTDWSNTGTHSLHGDLSGNTNTHHEFSPVPTNHIATLDFYYKLSATEDRDDGYNIYIYVGDYSGWYVTAFRFSVTYYGRGYIEYLDDADNGSYDYTNVQTSGSDDLFIKGNTYHIQMYIKIATTTDSNDGEIVLYVDGSEILSADNLDNFSDHFSTSHHFSSIRILCNYSDDYDTFYLDSFVFTDTLSVQPDKTLTVSSSISKYTHPTGDGVCNVTTGSYAHGTTVYVLATPDEFSHLDHWLLDSVPNYNNPITVEMSANHTLQPVFDWGVLIQNTDGFADFPTGYTNHGASEVTSHYISAPSSVEVDTMQEYFIKDLSVDFNGNWGSIFYFGSLHSTEPNPYPLITSFSDDYKIQSQIFAQVYSFSKYKLQSIVWSDKDASPFYDNGTLNDFVTSNYSPTDIVDNLGLSWYQARIYYWVSSGEIEVIINNISYGNFTVNNPDINAKYLCFGNPYKYYNIWGNRMFGDVNYDDLKIAYMNLTDLEFLNITINSWLFRNEVYELNTWFKGVDIAQFNISDTVHTLMFNWNNSTQKGDVTVLDEDGTYKNEYVVGGVTVTPNFYNNETDNIIWKFILNNNIVDCLNSTWTYKISDNLYTITGDTGAKSSLYNQGGLAEYNFGGDGYIVAGGSALQLSAKNSSLIGGGSFAEAWLIYRRLQYYHTLLELDLDNKVYGESLAGQTSIGELEYSIDYKLNDLEDGDWIEGLKCIIAPFQISVGTNGGGSDSAWIKYSVTWYSDNIEIFTDHMTTYSYAYSYWVGDAPSTSVGSDFCTNRTSIPIWIDFWFDKAEGSKVLGGRVNSQYFGEYEDGVSWWLGYGGFRPTMTNITASMAFTPITDGSNNTISSERISLVRIRAKLTKTWNGTLINGYTGDDDRWSLLPYQYTTMINTMDRMKGIDTPTFVETKEVKLQGYSPFDPVSAILSSLGGIITGALFSMVKMMIGSIDTVLSWVGLPYGTFSSLINMMTNGFSLLLSKLLNIVSMLSSMLSLITLFVTTVLNFVTYAISIILFFGTDLFSIPLQVIALLLAVLNGTFINFYGIPLDFTPYAPLMVALKTMMVPFAGIYLIVWIVWGNIEMRGEPDVVEAMGRVIDIFGFMAKIYNNLFWIFNKMRNEVISIYNFVRSHIPFMGSGGGGTNEGTTTSEN